MDVLVQALVAVGAGAVLAEVHALGHLAEVILVQEFAGLATLAQTAQPMLAYHAVPATMLSVGVLVLVRTGAAEGAVALQICFADGTVGIEADSVFFAEEGGEGEVGDLEGLGRGEEDVGHCEARREMLGY